VRDYLITSATESINTMVKEAEEIARLLAPAGAEPASDPVVAETVQEDDVFVDMPDGTRARLIS
jgi:hypothetical protein